MKLIDLIKEKGLKTYDEEGDVYQYILRIADDTEIELNKNGEMWIVKYDFMYNMAVERLDGTMSNLKSKMESGSTIIDKHIYQVIEYMLNLS